MHRRFNPPTILAPTSNYVHGVVSAPGLRWLHISGQIGIGPDGQVGQGFAEQADIAWSNILAILGDAAMTPEDLVKITTYVTSAADVPIFRGMRRRWLPITAIASTLVVVAGLAMPDLVVEIEAVAAAT